MKKLLRTLAAVFATVAQTAVAQSPADIPPGLIAWWRGEDNPKDAVGGADGTMQGGVGFAEGNTGQAFDFTGNPGQTVLVPASDEIDIGASPAGFTIEFWVNPASSNGNPLMEWSNPGGGSGVHIWANLYGAGSVYFNWDSGGNTLITAPGLIPAGAWHHIAFSYDKPSGMSRLYINGVEAATRHVGSVRALTTTALTLGHRVGGISMHGKLDEVSLYDRPLSIPEISAIFQAGNSGKDTSKPYFTAPDSLPDGITGAPYSFTMTAGITTGPHTFAITDGALPPGLTLGANGLISGTPAVDANSTFLVQATSNAGETNTRAFTLRTYGAPQGMVAWWRGQNDAQDTVGSNHCTLSNVVNFTAGKVGTGFTFGLNGILEVAHSASLANQQFTIEAWARPDGPPPGSANDAFGSILIAKNLSAAGESLAIYRRATDNRFLFRFGAAGTDQFLSANAFPPGQFYHVAASYDGAVFRLHVNGVLEGQFALVKTLSYAPAQPWLVGNSDAAAISFGYERRWMGVLDELSIYNRALTASEVAAIYNAGTSGKNPNKPYFTNLDTPPDGGVGTPYSVQFAAAVTPGPHTFTLDSGTLPPGLDFHSDGLLHGTPTAATTASFSIAATSSLGQTNTRTFSVNVAACLDPAPTGMVAWWRGQDDALDAIGTNHGTLNNGVLYNSGKVGRCFDFDGVDDTVAVPDGTLWDFGQNDFTIELWFNTRLLKNSVFVSQQSGSAAGGFSFHYFRNEDKLYFNRNTGNPVIGRSWLPQTHRWYHLAVTRTEGTYRLYVDGQQLGAELFDSNPVENLNGNLRLGGLAGIAGFDVAGQMDEITVYQRSLTNAEIAAIHSAGAGGKSGALYLTMLSPLPNAGQGAPYSQLLALTGGTVPYTFSLLSGTLPAGLSLSAAGVISGTPTGLGMSDFTVRVTDAQTRPAERHYFLKVNARPVLGAITNQSVNELALLTVPNPATDADAGDVLTYSLIAPPVGASISPTGVITWTPTEAQGPGIHTITTQVTDNGTPPLSATNSFEVTVGELNVAPTLPAQAAETVNELATLTVTNTATDTDLPANGLTYTLLTPPVGASISPTGVITWTPTEAQGPGVFTLTTRVTDDGTPPLSATNSFTVTVNEINAPPSLPTQANRTLDELTLLTVANGGADIDQPANNLTYSLLAAPTGAAIDAAGTITWTPTEAQGPGVFTLTTRVTDDGTPPLSATNSFTVTVNEINNPPSLPTQANRTLDELAPLTVANAGTDIDQPANNLTYALVAAPAGAAIDAAGTITWTPTEAQGPGVFTLTTRVTDDGNPPLSTTNSFTVTVNEVNTAPMLIELDDTSVDELSLLTVIQSGSDADLPANVLTYSLTEAPPGATISSTGVITWTPNQDQGPGTYTITTQVTDNGSPALNDTKSFTVTVTEPPPVIVEIHNYRIENNEFHFEVHGPPGNYIVSVSSDLIGWSTLVTANGATPPFEVIDPVPSGRKSLYYKATRVP